MEENEKTWLPSFFVDILVILTLRFDNIVGIVILENLDEIFCIICDIYFHNAKNSFSIVNLKTYIHIKIYYIGI